jgi:hypothetical protein
LLFLPQTYTERVKDKLEVSRRCVSSSFCQFPPDNNNWECCTEDFCNDPNANTNSGINDKFHAGVLTFILSLLLTLRL